jgi:hypothetical protein
MPARSRDVSLSRDVAVRQGAKDPPGVAAARAAARAAQAATQPLSESLPPGAQALIHAVMKPTEAAEAVKPATTPAGKAS